jgi:hypothetical protein
MQQGLHDNSRPHQSAGRHDQLQDTEERRLQIRNDL